MDDLKPLLTARLQTGVDLVTGGKIPQPGTQLVTALRVDIQYNPDLTIVTTGDINL
jgi:hypothetical protein